MLQVEHKPLEPMGSYEAKDCVFLLKNLNGIVEEVDVRSREGHIQRGGHYSELLPIEYMPTQEYMDLYHKLLEASSEEIAYYVGVVAELIYQKKGQDVVIVSLARAGTPIGVLIKRYLQHRYGIEVAHYSISIIRDIGIDENAVRYILSKHKPEAIQFVDGWTGKGVIGETLTSACKRFENQYGIRLDDTLAVLCDPGECTSLYGTREDLLIPSACLNATISGLVSRTFYHKDIIGSDDFHGAKYYDQWQEIDKSNHFIKAVEKYFEGLVIQPHDLEGKEPGQFNAARSVDNIRKQFDINSINRVKPGIGETTRVLLRRIPWKILIKEVDDPRLAHILLLANEKGVTVEVYPDMCYACCGLIENMK